MGCRPTLALGALTLRAVDAWDQVTYIAAPHLASARSTCTRVQSGVRYGAGDVAGRAWSSPGGCAKYRRAVNADRYAPAPRRGRVCERRAEADYGREMTFASLSKLSVQPSR
jgi:hypothetical protein